MGENYTVNCRDCLYYRTCASVTEYPVVCDEFFVIAIVFNDLDTVALEVLDNTGRSYKVDDTPPHDNYYA